MTIPERLTLIKCWSMRALSLISSVLKVWNAKTFQSLFAAIFRNSDTELIPKYM